MITLNTINSTQKEGSKLQKTDSNSIETDLDKDILNSKPVDVFQSDNTTKNDSLLRTKWLYMDALNFGHKFFEKKGNHWKVLEAVEKIKEFIITAWASGWKIRVFIDAATQSDEAIEKWQKRREAEVMNEIRDVSQGMNTLLGDAFQENDVEVFYSKEADNDDTLAAFAHRDNAAILSGDRDFFRYTGLRCPIFGDFEVKDNHLHLIELQPNYKTATPREIISPIPQTITKDLALVELSQNIYRRGAPSPLVRRLGNPHLNARSLRAALYSRKGVIGAIKEIFPVWGTDKTVWSEEDVGPDSMLDHLLDNPKEALEFLFPKSSLIKPAEVSGLDWQNHLYALHAIVYEICALGSKDEKSLLEVLRPAIVEFTMNNELEKAIVEAPAYEAPCKFCKITIKLTREELKFYKEKGFSMPKQCKACKNSNLKKRPNDFRRDISDGTKRLARDNHHNN